MFTKVFITAAFASAVSAQINPLMHLAVQTPAPTAVEARQDADACSSQLEALVTEMPQPADAGLESWISEYYSASATIDPFDAEAICEEADAVPQSLSSAYSSYNSEIFAWWVTEEPAVESALSACAGTKVNVDMEAYVTAMSSYTEADCAGASPTIPTEANFAPRVTGAAAGALAGLVGAAVLL